MHQASYACCAFEHKQQQKADNLRFNLDFLSHVIVVFVLTPLQLPFIIQLFALCCLMCAFGLF